MLGCLGRAWQCYGEGRKAKDLQMVLYFIRTKDEETDKSEIDELYSDPELQQVVTEFKDVFQNELHKGLPPQRDIDHWSAVSFFCAVIGIH